MKELANLSFLNYTKIKQKPEEQRLQLAQSPSVNWGGFLETCSVLPAVFRASDLERSSLRVLVLSLLSLDREDTAELEIVIGIFTSHRRPR